MLKMSSGYGTREALFDVQYNTDVLYCVRVRLSCKGCVCITIEREVCYPTSIVTQNKIIFPGKQENSPGNLPEFAKVDGQVLQIQGVNVFAELEHIWNSYPIKQSIIFVILRFLHHLLAE